MGPLVLAGLIFGGFASGLGQTPPSLSGYIRDELKWDPAQSGPLIAIDPEHTGPVMDGTNVYPRDGFACYQRKLVKVGGLSVVALSWEIDIDDGDIPNPYQALSPNEKLVFLLANLSNDDLNKLAGPGLCANDLDGEPRAALLSMIPKPFRYLPGMTKDGGVSSNQQAQQLSEADYPKVRLQFRKSLQAYFAPSQKGQGVFAMEHGLSGLTVRDGLPMGIFAGGQLTQQAAYLGHISPSHERSSEINWQQPALAKMCHLSARTTVGDAVYAISHATGLELYANPVVSSQPLVAFGDRATARDYLRGIALAIGGCYRKVGPAYFLTSALEGSASRKTSLRAQIYTNRLTILSQTDKWSNQVTRRHVLERIRFATDDPFGADLTPPQYIADDLDDYTKGWVPISDLPHPMRDAISRELLKLGSTSADVPISYRDKARITSAYAYRFCLPNGLPVQGDFFSPYFSRHASRPTVNGEADRIQVSRSGASIAIGIRSDDPVQITELCKKIHATGVDAIWLDSVRRDAILAAVKSGLKVDLLIDPWRILPGETCNDIDRTIVGWSGNRLNQESTIHLDPLSCRTFDYADSFSPGDSLIRAHIFRLVNAIPKDIVRQVVLRNSQPSGYVAPSQNRSMDLGTNVNGVNITPPVQDMVPEATQFGYCQSLRLAFLRSHHTDPIDVDRDFYEDGLIRQPYFDKAATFDSFMDPHPEMVFPIFMAGSATSTQSEWQKVRSDAWENASQELKSAFEKAGIRVFFETLKPNGIYARFYRARIAFQGQILGLPAQTTIPEVDFADFNPWNAENADGELFYRPSIPKSGTFCFDLSDVPADKFDRYLAFLFTKSR